MFNKKKKATEALVDVRALAMNVGELAAVRNPDLVAARKLLADGKPEEALKSAYRVGVFAARDLIKEIPTS